ncbi:MAG: DUF167 domain-containing protein [Acidobacteria bacterium]|nr:DUF167 domain-containing protein [Acidobacteriota bacterium]
MERAAHGEEIGSFARREGRAVIAAEISLVDIPGGCRLRVSVRAGGRADAIAGPHAGALKLSVVAAPERGRANRAVVELLASALGLPRSAVTIASGHTSPVKAIRVEGIDSANALVRLDAARTRTIG